MVIQDLSRQASLDVLTRIRMGRLGCARGAQPYVVPIYFVHQQDYLYSFSTFGQKIEWMRANPLVCVEADEVVSAREWTSVIVFGFYEELPDMPEWQSARAYAHRLLQQHAMWWEPAYVRTILHGAPRPLVPIFYRIQIREMTGHRATAAPMSPPDRVPPTASSEISWLQRLRRRVQGTRSAMRRADRLAGSGP